MASNRRSQSDCRKTGSSKFWQQPSASELNLIDRRGVCFAFPRLAFSFQKEKKPYMRRVTGLGGVFFKADDPDKLYEWYEQLWLAAAAFEGLRHRPTHVIIPAP